MTFTHAKARSLKTKRPLVRVPELAVRTPTGSD